MTTLSSGHPVDVAAVSPTSLTAGHTAAGGPPGAASDGTAGAGQPHGPGAGLVNAPSDYNPVATYHLNVDGMLHTVSNVWVGASLLSVLRTVLGITSVKDACEQGRCGSCSVLVDGRLVAACTVLAADAADTRVTTVAGLAPTGPVGAVQAALLTHGAVQCGFCTPGLVVAITDLLGRGTSPDDEEIREALAGNVCRCTGYGRVIAAVRALVDSSPEGMTWHPATSGDG
jgi:carbon-monoxide dehydrogenase small subunit